LLSLPLSKRHWCDSIATTEHSVGGLNGRVEAGATAGGGDTDGRAAGVGGDEDSLGAGAVAIGTHAVTKESTPTARRNPLNRMTEP
jgi:hypothetical protein